MSEFDHSINTIEQLRRIVKQSPRQGQTLMDRLYGFLDGESQEYIQSSPMVFVGTANAEGSVEVSPKGDAPGFVRVLDEKKLLLPERKGNTDVRGLKNLITNPHISLLFVIPGVREILRVNGRATITMDPDYLNLLQSLEKPALLCIKIQVEECFFHCARAFTRSQLWVPERWPQEKRLYKSRQVGRRLNISAQEAEALSIRNFEKSGESDGAD